MEKGDSISIDELWDRIKAHEGEVFTQKRGQEFTYTMSSNGEYFIPSTTKWNIRKKDFEEAKKFVPLKTTTEIQHVHGPSYVFAVIMDERINGGHW